MKRFLLTLFFALTVLHVSIPHAQDTRQFYLSPIDGAGTDADPWRSRCDRGIDLRPFISINYFLCASNALPPDTTGVVQIGASAKSAITGRKAALVAITKKAIVADTVDEAIKELLLEKVRAGKDGKLYIYLGGESFYQRTAWVPFEDGGLVADLANSALGLIEPTLAWAATYTDTFTGADGNLAGDLTWTEFTLTNWTRTSNKAYAEGSTPASNAEARAEHDTATDDHSVQADITYTYGSGALTRCTVIARKDSTTTRTYYGFGTQRDVGVDTYRLLARSAGSPTTLGDSSAATSSSATIKIVADGTSISGYVNGALSVGPITDATISAKMRGGLAYASGAAGDNCSADNFEVKDYTATTHRKSGSIWFQ